MFGHAPDLELVGSVENGEGVIDAVRRLRPQVVIMDVRLPGIDGISAVKRIGEAAPEVHTVIFSAYGDKRLLSDAILDVAEEQQADLIVVGNKGMTGAKRFLLGSVPNKISHHAPCSVMIIRTS